MSGNTERKKKRILDVCYAPNFGIHDLLKIKPEDRHRFTLDIDEVGCIDCAKDACFYNFITEEERDSIIDEIHKLREKVHIRWLLE